MIWTTGTVREWAFSMISTDGTTHGIMTGWDSTTVIIGVHTGDLTGIPAIILGIPPGRMVSMILIIIGDGIPGIAIMVGDGVTEGPTGGIPSMATEADMYVMT